MTEQYNAISASQARAYLGEVPPPAPLSSAPPPPQQNMWPEDQVLALLQEERDAHALLEQQLAQWQQYGEQMQAEQQQWQQRLAQLENARNESSPVPSAASAQVTQALHQELDQALKRVQASEAQLAEAEQRAQVAEQRLQFLQEHVDSEPPPAPSLAPAGFDPAQAAFAQAAAPEFHDDLDSAAAGRRGVPMLMVLLLVGGLLGAAAGAYFGVVVPQLQRERLTAQQSAELMRTETQKLRDQLEAQRSQSETQVADLTRELKEAKTSVSAASAAVATPTPDAPVAEAAPARAQRAKANRGRGRARARAKAKARRRAQAKRRARAKNKRKTTRANDPIAGLDGM